MSQYFQVHPDNPQARLIRQAGAILHAGGVVVYPTDSSYGLGCAIGATSKEAVERIRTIRQMDTDHLMSLVCRDLSEIAAYAHVDNSAFRLLKSLTPGPYTFILKATSEVPKRLQHPKRKSIGLRVPDHRVTQALLGELDGPLVSTTLQLPESEVPLNDPEEIRERLERQVDLVIDAGPCNIAPTTILDLSEGEPRVVRRGIGPLDWLEQH